MVFGVPQLPISRSASPEGRTRAPSPDSPTAQVWQRRLVACLPLSPNGLRVHCTVLARREGRLPLASPIPVSRRSLCTSFCQEDEEGEVTSHQSSIFTASGGLSVDTIYAWEDLLVVGRLR